MALCRLGGALASLAEKEFSLKTIILLVVIFTLSGCSATSLRCAVDGDSQYVELYNIPQNFSQNVRAYGELCGFTYQGVGE